MDKQSLHSIDAEKACLGAIFLDPTFALFEISEFLKPGDFYHNAHQVIYKTILSLYSSNQPIDTIAVVQKLKDQNLLEQCGGAVSIASLSAGVPTSANIRYYADIIWGKSKRRELLTVLSECKEQAEQDHDLDIESILNQTEQKVFQIVQQETTSNTVHAREVLKDVIHDMERNKGKSILGLSSGKKNIDNMTLGFKSGEFIILAARPSMGKTALAVDFVSDIVLRQKIPALFFSVEMPRKKIVTRMIANVARLDSKKIQAGALSPDEWEKFYKAAKKVNESSLFIDDTSNISYGKIRSIARRFKVKENIRAIFIDYLQLVSVPIEKKHQNRENVVSEISRALKALAKDLEVPVIALSQLSRANEKRTDKTPQLSDLRESGAIEQDADVVMFLHRPSYYAEKGTPDASDKTAQLIFAKNRDGETGLAELVFLPEYSKFEDKVVY